MTALYIYIYWLITKGINHAQQLICRSNKKPNMNIKHIYICSKIVYLPKNL